MTLMLAREIDQTAKDISLRRYALPECLHVPIAAENEEVIAKYIGDIKAVVVVGTPNKVLVVMVDPPPPRDTRLPIWSKPESAILFEQMQVWVHVNYNGYRRA